MTREEKAKAYDEALKRAKFYYNNCPLEPEKKKLEAMFPELAESEDERMIEMAIKAVYAPEAQICIKSWGVNPEDVIAWLEKKKENPKSADSIPSDCLSNAKCEDRWRKVGDSLPDNGREVLAKDKLGNILLARYDGEGWDVSVYDDEDYRCHNGISKWCEIPSEKQKEQKPSISCGHENDIEWSEGDENALGYLHELISFGFAKKFFDAQTAADMREWLNTRLKSLRPQPKQEWSDEDKTHLIHTIHLIEDVSEWAKKDGMHGRCVASCDEILPWLKSLRPYPHWKPSKEQMQKLYIAIRNYESDWGEEVARSLCDLYEQLKKL